MQLRRAAVVLATLVAACSSESPVAPTPPSAPQLAKGGGSSGGGSTPTAPTAAVAGAWTGTYRRSANPGDTTQWTLNLRQNGANLEGGFIFMTYVDGRYSSVGVSAIKKGSVVEKYISLFRQG